MGVKADSNRQCCAIEGGTVLDSNAKHAKACKQNEICMLVLYGLVWPLMSRNRCYTDSALGYIAWVTEVAVGYVFNFMLCVVYIFT